MNEGKARLVETHVLARAHTHVRAHMHSQLHPFTRRLPLKAQAHTLDFLPFFLAEDSHGSGRRNPFSTDAGTAVLILNETQLVLPLSVCSKRLKKNQKTQLHAT